MAVISLQAQAAQAFAVKLSEHPAAIPGGSSAAWLDARKAALSAAGEYWRAVDKRKISADMGGQFLDEIVIRARPERADLSGSRHGCAVVIKRP